MCQVTLQVDVTGASNQIHIFVKAPLGRLTLNGQKNIKIKIKVKKKKIKMKT